MARRSSGPWGPFRPLVVDGLQNPQRQNLYFGVVNPNPARAGTLLGLFPTALENGASFVGLAASCDGVTFSALENLLNCSSGAALGRAPDQPADGILVRGDRAYVYVHRDVPGVARHTAARPWTRSRLVRLEVGLAELAGWTERVVRGLGGCGV